MWKKIDIYDGRYSINEYGAIKNTKTNKILKDWISNKGYRIISLRENRGTKKDYLVHRLVAKSFCENKNNYPIVLHLDSNPLNCYYKNLKWGTYSENNKQAVAEGHMIVPTPDNRKNYLLYNETSPISIKSLGLKHILSIVDKKDSNVRSHILRDTKIIGGDFDGWKVKLL